MSVRRARRALTLTTVLSLALAACSTGSESTTTTSPMPSIAATMTSGSPTSTSVAAAIKVSANDASESELVAALTAAGVPNVDRWAREVMEYRPYATDDPTLQKLQDNLAKYNPDAATLAAILAALEP
jgi:hypothetical protein